MNYKQLNTYHYKYHLNRRRGSSQTRTVVNGLQGRHNSLYIKEPYSATAQNQLS